jgi:hypothetical protein
MSRIAIVLAALVLCACSKSAKPGEACRPDQSSCKDPKTGWLCADGVILEVPCKGPEGCKAAEGAPVTCDVRGNAGGDPCTGAPNVCTEDKKARVECLQKKIQISACRGPEGCFLVGDRMECDRSLAMEGDPCNFITASDACSPDAKRALTCKQGKFVTLAVCRGPAGCKPVDMGVVACDVTKGELGDPCMPNSVTCSMDGKSRLACKDAKLVLAEACTGPQGCHGSTGVAAECDRSTASAGDACSPMSHACAAGTAGVLACQDGKFVLEKACGAGEKCVARGAGFACAK